MHRCRCSVPRLGFAIALQVALMASLVPVAAAQGQKQVPVPAAVEWTDTGIDLLPGDILLIRAAGEWSNVASGGFVGQDGYGSPYPGTTLASAPLASLLMRVGTIVAQARAADTPVRWRGRLSLGMNDVAGTFGDNRGSLNAYVFYTLRPAPIRDFTGLVVTEARKWLSSYGIEPVIRMGPSPMAEGLIYEQSPKPAVDLHGVPEVQLFVSTGPPQLVTVPAITGLSVRAALSTLTDSGLGNIRVDSIDEPGPTALPEDSMAWSVASQHPQAGSRVTKNALIRLFAGATPSRRVPGFVDRTDQEARKEAQAHGFSLEMRRQMGIRFFRSVVVRQTPPAGTYVLLSELHARVEVADPIPLPVPLAALAGLGAFLWWRQRPPGPYRDRLKPPPPGTTYHARVAADPPELRSTAGEELVHTDLTLQLTVGADPPQLASSHDPLIRHEAQRH